MAPQAKCPSSGSEKKKEENQKQRRVELDLLVVDGGLQLLRLAHLADSLGEVLRQHRVALVADGKQTRLGAHVAQIRPVESIRQLPQREGTRGG